MDVGEPRAPRGTISRRRTTGAEARVEGRPDRIALWALVVALFVAAVAVATADASSGGAGPGGSTSTAYASSADFGDRTLRKGNRGNDVKTLNWVLKSLPYGKPPGQGTFGSPTHQTVKSFQRKHGMSANGVVGSGTRKKLAKTLKTGFATYYGPGLYGNRTACGQKLTKKTIGFATSQGSGMKCGSAVVFKYGGRWIRATKIDTGSFTGPCFDLTYGLKKKLGFGSSGNVKYARASGARPC